MADAALHGEELRPVGGERGRAGEPAAELSAAAAMAWRIMVS